MKRSLLYIVVVSLVLLLISCASTEEPTELIFDESRDEDMYKGYVCSIFNRVTNNSYTSSSEAGTPFGYSGETVFGDNMIKRVSDVENETECILDIQYEGPGIDALLLGHMIGEYTTEAFFADENSLDLPKKFNNANLVVPFDDLDAVDLTDHEKWGHGNVLEIFGKNGKVCEVIPVAWMFKQPNSFGILAFNSELEARYGLSNVQEYYENGNWNWQVFDDVLDARVVDTGDMFYNAITTRFFDYIKLAVFSNGVSWVRKDGSSVVCDLGEDPSLEAVDWVRSTISRNPDIFQYGTKEGGWDVCADHFAAGDVFILVTSNTIFYNYVAFRAENFYLMPFPTGPRGSNDRFAAMTESAACFGIYQNAREPEGAAMILNKLAEPMDSYPDYESLCSYLQKTTVDTITDARILMNINRNSLYSYFWGTSADSLWRAFQDNGIFKYTSKEIFEKYENMVDELIGKEIGPNLEIYEKYDPEYWN